MDIPANYRSLEGSERHPIPGAKLSGSVDPNETLSITIVLRRRPDGPPMPDLEYWQKTPLSQRPFYSVDEFAQRYGATQADLDAVVNFVTAQGMTVDEANSARRTVIATGTAAQMNSAFAIDLNWYEIPQHRSRRRERQTLPAQQRYRERDGFIYIPANLANIIDGIFGLDNLNITQRNNMPDPPLTGMLTVPDIMKLYNFPTNMATGQTIGIVSINRYTPGGYHGGYNTSDIQQYYTNLKNPPSLIAPTLVDVSVEKDSQNNQAQNNPTNPDPETTQDICIASTVAQGAKIAVYFHFGDEAGWMNLLSHVIAPNPGEPVISVLSSSLYISDGDDKPTLMNEGFGYDPSFLDNLSKKFQDAAAAHGGITICIASGDQGSDSKVGSTTGTNDWEKFFAADGKAHVQYPGSDPWVLSCGGTTVGYSNGSNFEEYVWNDITYSPGLATPNWATGGGVSDHFPQPAYQSGVGVPVSVNDGHTGRGVPDVAGNASLNSGYSSMYLQGTSFPGGGTSAVAPLYAGLIAVINEALGKNVGFLNPTLYALGQSVCRDINPLAVTPPAGPMDNSLNGITGYPAGPGWDACTGLGVIDGNALLAQLQALFTPRCTILTDRSTYGQDEIDALRKQQSGPVVQNAVVQNAFFVIVDGFTPKDLGITDSSSLSAAPMIKFVPSTGVTNKCSSLTSDDPSFGPEVQRFRFGYDVNFGNDDSAFTSFSGDSEPVMLQTTYQGLSASGQVQFIKQPDPYILQGSQNWWLSNDIRLIQVADGETQFGQKMDGDPFAFLSAVTKALEDGQGVAGGQSFDTNTLEDNEVITIAPQNSQAKNVYNFAIARVHYQGKMSNANNVRVFFRLFAANSTATDFQPGSTYARYAAYSPTYPVPPADYYQNVLPTLGVSAGEYVSIPCFGEARKDPTQVGAPNSLPSLQTPDGFINVRTIQATGGPLHDTFYGCWLDINQVTSTSPSKLPSMPPSGNEDGPWPEIALEPLQQAFIVNEHQCLVAEIAFDLDPISTGTPPWNTDKLAQRNISWSSVANPGVAFSREALEPFEIRPTPAIVGDGEWPDELMIDWMNVPAGQQAEIYLPAVDADAVLEKATELYRTLRLTRVDAHTIGCTTGSVSYIPLPKGARDGANFVGLMSVNLPYGIRKGQQFTILVRQLTNASGEASPPPPLPLRIADRQQNLLKWRRVLGTFQINIPVSTKELLLPKEEQRLSIFRWIAAAMPPERRWYPVFQRYIERIARRVQGLGGDPTQIPPSPTGQIPGTCSPKPCESEETTGKIEGLLYDHFGDFEGFFLETHDGRRHRFNSTESKILKLVYCAWVERTLVTVVFDSQRPHIPRSIILHGKPPRLIV